MSKFDATEVVDENHEFFIPVKAIKTPNDMMAWEKSEAYSEYLGFILAMNEAVQGLANSMEGYVQSESVCKLMRMLGSLDDLINETPPIQQPQRFGNQAFRLWSQKLKQDAFNLLQKVLPPELYRAIPEIMSYLVEGFGNATRIDYGTGHEISFLMFIYCLFKIGFLKDQDKPSVPCKIFSKYLQIVRKLQEVYRMEPAGSHGVWSLDDYQFVPFIWGSSQLIDHPQIEPTSFLNPEIVEAFADEYLFLGCIQYINKVKTGPFAEHSNQLWSVSGVSSWSKINGGLIKMYKVEVLGKFPVIQHVLFGSLLPMKPSKHGMGYHKRRKSVTPPTVSSENLNKDTGDTTDQTQATSN